MDEVDRMLDMGFKKDVDMILSNLPKKKQCLLFSATVGKSIRDVARLNMDTDFESIQIDNYAVVTSKAEGAEDDVDEDGNDIKLKSITPQKLLHYHMELEIDEKLDTLFSFIKSHQKAKILVFMSTIKQVRFAYLAFKALKLTTNLFELHGK